MSCALCFCQPDDEQFIDTTSEESRRLNVASILYTYFRFCFSDASIEGYVCQKCWVKVSVFHEFYTHIEYVHRSKESIFVENFCGHIKTSLDSMNDKLDLQILPDDEPRNMAQRKHLLRSKKRPFVECNVDNVSHGAGSECDTLNSESAPAATSSNEESMNSQKRKSLTVQNDSTQFADFDSESDDTDHFNDNFDMNYVDSIAPSIKSEITKTNSAKPRKKSGKPSKALKSSSRSRSNTKKMKQSKRRQPNESGTFQCETCELHFLTFSCLNRHIKETHNAKEFKCTESKCVDSFDTQKLLDDHCTAKHQRAECVHCKKMILQSFIARHIRMRHEANNVVCELCGKVSLSERMHTEHYKMSHECVERLQCDLCGQTYKNKHMMKIHMVTHISGPMVCPICGHVSPHRRAWNVHTRSHRPGIRDRQKCDVCGRGFREKRLLEEHYHIHTGTAGSYHCEECGKTFRFSSSFSVHKKKIHPK